MTLNAVITLILRFFTDFQADYITVVKDRPIMSVKYSLPTLLLLAKTITHPAVRSLCDSWASCLHRYQNTVYVLVIEHFSKLWMNV